MLGAYWGEGGACAVFICSAVSLCVSWCLCTAIFLRHNKNLARIVAYIIQYAIVSLVPRYPPDATGLLWNWEIMICNDKKKWSVAMVIRFLTILVFGFHLEKSDKALQL